MEEELESSSENLGASLAEKILDMVRVEESVFLDVAENFEISLSDPEIARGNPLKPWTAYCSHRS